jgi:hypothetical protein
VEVSAGCDGGDGARTSKVGLRGGRQGNAARGASPWRCCGQCRAAHPDGFGYMIVGSANITTPSRADCDRRCGRARRRREGLRRLCERRDRRRRSHDRRGAAIKLFVAVMAASNLSSRRRGERAGCDWIDAHMDLFAFLGGLPEVRGLRQSQSGRHKPGPLRAGPEPSQVFRLDLAKPSNVTRRCSISS